jgi:hypothetical protein
MIRLRAAGANTWEAQRILWLLESNLRRFGGRRDRRRANVAKCWLGRLIGSDETVRNPSLGSDRERHRRLTALHERWPSLINWRVGMLTGLPTAG